jgi:uncharacterized integral membrane protein
VLRRALTYLLAVPAAIILITLAVSNRHAVRLVLDPFRPDEPLVSLLLPFYVYLFAAVLLGILVGGWVTWRAQAYWRRNARRQTAEAQRWRAEAHRLARERDKQVSQVVTTQRQLAQVR